MTIGTAFLIGLMVGVLATWHIESEHKNEDRRKRKIKLNDLKSKYNITEDLEDYL